ncbi:hypothetical protein D3C87_270240 [compost metagenome]
MDFEKKYRITQFPGETLKAMWTRGYRNIEIYYQDQLICTHEGVSQLKNGVKYQTKELGEIELKLSAKPITLDVIVGGYHCENNVSHPAKQLKGASSFFWMIAVFAIISSLMDGIYFGVDMSVASIVTIINFSVIAVYMIAAVFTNQSKPWAFYLGFSMFCFWTLFALLGVLSGNIFIILAFLIRLAFLYFLIVNIKHAVNTTRHNRFKQPVTVADDILDGEIK